MSRSKDINYHYLKLLSFLVGGALKFLKNKPYKIHKAGILYMTPRNVLKIYVAFQEHISMRSLVSGSVCLYEIGLQIYEKEYKR